MKPELFSEVYNCYYQVVDKILKGASSNSFTEKDICRLAELHGYEETPLAIVPKLTCGEWSLLHFDGTYYHSKVDNFMVMPLTALQKSWLKSLLSDERAALFLTDEQLDILNQYLQDVTPLYRTSDFLSFDQYKDKDPFHAAHYRSHFQMILRSITNKQLLQVDYLSGKGNMISHSYLPCRIEYSSKDNKFRLLALKKSKAYDWVPETINIARIIRINTVESNVTVPVDMDVFLDRTLGTEPVVLEISRERNALERTMLHFASYKKRTEPIPETGKYICSIYYDKTVETDLLIQILSFGPVVKVLGPPDFLNQVRERVLRQDELLQSRVNQNSTPS